MEKATIDGRRWGALWPKRTQPQRVKIHVFVDGVVVGYSEGLGILDFTPFPS